MNSDQAAGACRPGTAPGQLFPTDGVSAPLSRFTQAHHTYDLDPINSSVQQLFQRQSDCWLLGNDNKITKLLCGGCSEVELQAHGSAVQCSAGAVWDCGGGEVCPPSTEWRGVGVCSYHEWRISLERYT